MNALGAAIFAEYDLERIAAMTADAAVRLAGAAAGGFYCALSVAGHPAPADAEELTRTFDAQGTLRSPDIRKDFRLGCAPAHWLRLRQIADAEMVSGLAVPVRSKEGEFLGCLLLGHPGGAFFDERAQRIVEAIAIQAALAIDNVRLHGRLLRIEQTLEQKVGERTAELAAANQRLTHEIAERERVEGRFQHLVEGVTDYALFMLEPDGIIANWNTGAERIKGYRASEIVGRHFETFYTEEERAAGVPRRALETARREGKFEAEGQRVRKDGSRFWASVVINRINDSDGNLLGFAKITRDITERRRAQEELQRAQEQLAQAQKMEGIGQLTGGVAHDFNNLLTIILGNLETAQRASQGESTDRGRLARALEHATQGAQRAASLTQRLLAFSRRSPLDPKPLDANRLVTGMSEMLRRTLGEQITIETVLGGGLWQILADPNQLEIGIVNLAVNARDAMPNGGRLTIETANAHLDEGYAASQHEVAAGDYVVISISDTGIGMDRETLARALEPFFTTKDVGHGTGLGLSQVYGFAKQSGGHLRVYSELGHGTSVKIYLPRLLSEGEPAPEPEPPREVPTSGHGETILVVEDDIDVRANTTDMLRELRYRVLEASTAAAGLHLLERHPEIDLLFTDVGLPGGMNGRELADAAHTIRPDLKVLFTTGYARGAIVHGGRLDPGVQLLPKPFTYAALAAKLADILGSPRAAASVLLVEDEILVQMVAQEQLTSLGCRVEPASSIVQAMSKVKGLDGNIDMAIVDIGLPDGKGDRLAADLRALFPRLPVVIASGYDDEALRRRFRSDSHLRFLRKPYTQQDLEDVVDWMRRGGARPSAG